MVKALCVLKINPVNRVTLLRQIDNLINYDNSVSGHLHKKNNRTIYNITDFIKTLMATNPSYNRLINILTETTS